MHTIILFALSLFTRLNKTFCLYITNKALPDQATVTDLESDIDVFSSVISIYRGGVNVGLHRQRRCHLCYMA